MQRMIPAWPMERYVRDSFDIPMLPPTLNSGLAHVMLTRSAAHVRYSHPRLNPAWAPDDDSGFDLGTAAHAVLLEGKALDVLSFPDYRSSAARKARVDAKAAGMIPVLAHQASDVAAMVVQARALIASSPDLKSYDFDGGEIERSIVWQEGDTWLRCRPDWKSTDHRLILSVKTTGATAEPDGFLKLALSKGYDVQAAFELAAVKAITGTAPTHYIWLVMETDEPFACSLVGLSPMLRDLGERKMARAVTAWAHCLSTDEWPGYGEHVMYPDPPEWALVRFAERFGVSDPNESLEVL